MITGVVRADDRPRRLEEHDRLFRQVHVALGGVVAEVEADADDLAGAREGAPRREAGGERRCQPARASPMRRARDAVAAEKLFVVVSNVRGHVDARAVCVDYPGALEPGSPKRASFIRGDPAVERVGLPGDRILAVIEQAVTQRLVS